MLISSITTAKLPMSVFYAPHLAKSVSSQILSAPAVYRPTTEWKILFTANPVSSTAKYARTTRRVSSANPSITWTNSNASSAARPLQVVSTATTHRPVWAATEKSTG